MSRIVFCQTTGAVVASYCVRWDGGQTQWSGNKAIGGSAQFNLAEYGIPIGTSCWAVADVSGGEQGHESGDNVTYNDDGQVCTWDLDGTVFKVSFSLSCQ